MAITNCRYCDMEFDPDSDDAYDDEYCSFDCADADDGESEDDDDDWFLDDEDEEDADDDDE